MPLYLTDIEGLPANGATYTIGMMPDITLISTSDDSGEGVIGITCIIKCNGLPYIEEVYLLAPFASIKLNIQDLLKHVFEYTPPTLYSIAPQLSCNIKEIDITFSVGSYKEATTFLLINNRLEGIETDSFYESSFLSMQPRGKGVYISDREVLTCYVERETLIIMCRASNIAQSQTEAYIVSRVYGGVVDIVIDFNSLIQEFSIKNITSLYLFIDGYDNEEIYGQTYNILPGKAPAGPVFYFENTAGGFDLIRPTGEVKDKNKYKTEQAQRGRKTIGRRIENTNLINVNSGYLETQQERAFFRDFLESDNKYIFEKGELLSIITTEATAEAIQNELASFNFDYKKSITRSVTSARYDSIHIHHNELDSFRLSKQFTIYNGSGEMKVAFLRGIFAKSFSSPKRYQVAMSQRLRDRIKTSTLKQFVDRVEYTNITLNNADKPTRGFLTVTDNVTGEQAVAFIYIG